ncbi:MAG: 5'-methylthioadenosine/adenosylhomocysteine nucleosidase [Succinivibrionaceae bacterium]|nr:5'-methylthioadenosine/adenosylhomocysteine nucleosidase [Succinivibrionaceae bacterium]
MKIGIICAMKEELAPLLDRLSGCRETVIAGHSFFAGTLAGKDVVLTVSGIGKVQSALTATLAICALDVKAVINTGSAGGLKPACELSIGDVVVSSAVAYHDVDLTNFGYKPGQLPEHARFFRPDERLQKIALSCQDARLHSGLVVSGDQFVCTAKQHESIVSSFPDAMVCEMEGAPIGHVCSEFQIPFLVIRSVSDTADHESSVKFEEFLPVAASNSSAIAMHLLENL